MPIGRRPSGGFTLVVVLAWVALSSLAVSVAMPLWWEAQRRADERELWRVGQQMAWALASYRDTLPGSSASFPRELHELLRDPRISGVARHLRTIPADPLDPSKPWGLVRDEFGRIRGVFSQAPGRPRARGPVVLTDRTLPAAQRYSDWVFSARPRT